MNQNSINRNGFTLIELMIVMAIVGLLMALVGPLTINSLEKAQSKQEMLLMKGWLRTISAKAFTTGQVYTLTLDSNKAELFILDKEQIPLTTKIFDSLIFPEQVFTFNSKGFVLPRELKGYSRGIEYEVDLNIWVNRQEVTDNVN